MVPTHRPKAPIGRISSTTSSRLRSSASPKTKPNSAASAYRELKQRGFNVYPVHPTLATFDGGPCFPSPADLPTVPDCALIASNRPDAAGGRATIAGPRHQESLVPAGERFLRRSPTGRATRTARRSTAAAFSCTPERSPAYIKFHRFLSRLFGKY